MKKLRARAALLLVLLIAFGSSATTGQAAAALSAAEEDCAPVDIGREDFVVQTTSTLPALTEHCSTARLTLASTPESRSYSTR